MLRKRAKLVRASSIVSPSLRSSSKGGIASNRSDRVEGSAFPLAEVARRASEFPLRIGLVFVRNREGRKLATVAQSATIEGADLYKFDSHGEYMCNLTPELSCKAFK